MTRTSRWAVVAPVATAAVTTAVGTALTLSASGRLPDPLATHWGPDGPDGFSSLTSTLWTAGGVLVGTALLFTVLLAVVHRSARGLLAGFGAGTSAGVGVLVYGLTLRQAGLDDAAQAPGPGYLVPVALVVGLLLGLAVGRLMRQPAPELPQGRQGLSVPGDDRVAWLGSAGLPRRTQTVLLGLSVLLSGLTALVDLWLALLPVLVIVVVVLLGAATVRVDHRGLTVRSAGVVPLLRVPLERVETADVVQVSPFAEFGGWGMRIARDGRRGYVTRSGSALRVARVGEPDVLVTVDDADEAAAVLAGLVAVARPVG